jgi:hypothetical protein
MARPERNNVDYFPHPVTHGKKMFYIRSKFKNDGYAVWFILLEELGGANYHYLDLSDEVQLMYLSSQTMVSEELLLEIIETLVKFDEFDKNLWEQKILFSSKFTSSIEDAYSRRSNKLLHYEGLCSTLMDKCRLKHDFLSKIKGNKPQSKVEDTKVEDTKADTWRDSFGIYVKELSEKHLELIKDQEFISIQEKYNPNVNIVLSIEKAINNFWGTEAGWKNKKAKRTKTINWKSTLTKAIDMNKVWKSNEKNKSSNRGGFESDPTQRTIEQIQNGFE